MEGGGDLPSDSKVELRGDEEACKNLERPDQTVENGAVTFQDLPACKVRLWITVTGFDVKKPSLDLTRHKGSVRILIKAVGPPEVEW